MRSMIVIVQGEDYVQMSRAMGLKPWRVFYTYQVRNALLPQITFLALSLGFIVSGSALVEVVFVYPGIGTVLLDGPAVVAVNTFGRDHCRDAVLDTARHHLPDIGSENPA